MILLLTCGFMEEVNGGGCEDEDAVATWVLGGFQVVRKT